jgi:2-C-methyl-D-erythritol 2,4-cyclodiphosphate synthase
MSKIRIGFGFDVHRLETGRAFWLGGIRLEHAKGSLGHSDGDVLIHAICDALLGAANLRDIGYHFPNTSEEFKDIDSKKLLNRVAWIIRQAGFEIGNIDATVCLELPKINPHIPEMQRAMAAVLEIPIEDLSIKATTNEGLGYVGSENGVNAYAVVLLEKVA